MRYEVTGFIFKRNLPVSASITEEQFDATKDAKETCLHLIAFEERINLVLDNFNELECDLLTLAQNFLLRPDRSHGKAMSERLLLDRRLVNLLSACRLYLDQTDHTLSCLFGKECDERTKYNAERARYYDTHFGYRLLEALRNHVQHYSLAVGEITYTQGGATEPYDEYTVKPQLDVAVLDENPDFKSSVMAELKSKGRSIDVRGPLRRYISCLTELHLFVRKLTAGKLKTARLKYCEDVKNFSTNSAGEEVCIPTLVSTDDSKMELPVVKIPLPTRFLEYYDDLVKRRWRGDRLSNSFASNGGLTEGRP